MRKYQLFYTFILILFLVGCGSSSSSSSGDGESDSDSSDTAIISGTLGTGTVTSLGVINRTVASDYSVVVLDNSSNKTYRTTTDADGSFSVSVPTGSTYLLNIINDGSYIGPTVFDGSGTSVTTGIAPTADTSLGSITVDSTSGYAVVETAPGEADDTATAVAEDGVPVGSGNDGKTQQSGITNDTDSDLDNDGIPNLFDADEDNDGIRNGVASTPSGVSVVSNYVEFVFVSGNIWADHNTTESAEDLIAMRLHVVPVSGQEDQIVSVQCIDVPATIADVATIGWASSLGDPTDYPDEHSLWSDDGYNLYQTTTLDDEEWIVSITPRAIMEVGDTFTVRVTYTDASYEDFFITMSYVLTDWSRISTYNNIPMPTDEGTSSDPVNFSTNSLGITFTKPIDEDGNILEGLTYSIIVAESEYDASVGGYLVPGVSGSEETVEEEEGMVTLSYSVIESLITSGTTYYITPVAGSSDGQRNGEETWFTRD